MDKEKNTRPSTARTTTRSQNVRNLSPAQVAFIAQKTPGQYIKERMGPGGTKLKYVEVGYVINLLNQVFNWDWDFKILAHEIGKRQVWVHGELVVRTKERTITKEQYGGADIKFNRSTGEAVSIADDLKAAASDSLKKCASMLGVAGDVYWGNLDWNVSAPQAALAKR